MTASDPSGNIGRDTIAITRLPDTRPPSVVSTIPPNGAANFGVNSAISADFSETIATGSVTEATFQLVDGSGNPVSGTVSYSGNRAKFVPALTLGGITSYAATITIGVRDASGNAMTTPHVWTFTTGVGPDIVAPSVTSTAPASGVDCVGPDSMITASFSENIDAQSVDSSTFTLHDGSLNPVAGAISSSSPRSFVFAPLNGLSYATTYTGTLTTGIADSAGNPLKADHSWTFTTVPAGIGSWQPISEANAPTPREHYSAVWTGTEMIVWGGLGNNSFLNTGARYRPSTDTWVSILGAGAPSGRERAVAVWTGSEMIVWGGGTFGAFLDGARYNPATDTWRPMSNVGAIRSTRGTAVWSGTEMLIWDQFEGARYNPTSDSWLPISAPPFPLGGTGHTAVWTGSTMIVWGGGMAEGVYDPATDTWDLVGDVGAPSHRTGHTAVWTGSEMAIWGGSYQFGVSNTGALYNPLTKTWRSIAATCGNAGRAGHSAAWTGSELIVWGGSPVNGTGARYDPAADSWQHVALAGAPASRTLHTAFWTGTSMLIWGGWNQVHQLSTGGRYQP